MFVHQFCETENIRNGSFIIPYGSKTWYVGPLVGQPCSWICCHDDFDFRIPSTSSGFAKMLTVSVDPLSRMMSFFILLDMSFFLSIRHTCIPLHLVFFELLSDCDASSSSYFCSACICCSALHITQSSLGILSFSGHFRLICLVLPQQ